MTLNSTKKKFKELFGETVEPYNNSIVEAVSANSVIALVNEGFLNRFQSGKFTKYVINKIPKKEKQFQVVKFNNLYFDFDIIRKIIDNFLGSIIEVAVCSTKGVNSLAFKVGEYAIVMGEKREDRPETLTKYEINYNWNDIFNEQKTFASDMIL